MKLFPALCVLAIGLETGQAAPNDLSSWKVLAEGGAEVTAALDATPSVSGGQNTEALRVTVKRIGRRFGIVCADLGKTKLEPGQWHDFSFSARTDARKTFALTVSLETLDGKKVCARTTLPEVGGTNWTHFSVALHVHQAASKCRLVIALADTGNLWLNDIAVTLRQPALK